MKDWLQGKLIWIPYVFLLAGVLSAAVAFLDSGPVNSLAPLVVLFAYGAFVTSNLNGQQQRQKRWPILIGSLGAASAYLWFAAEEGRHPRDINLLLAIGIVMAMAVAIIIALTAWRTGWRE